MEANLKGYRAHSNEDLGKWAYDYWSSELGSAENVIFAHLLTHMTLLHAEYSKNADGSKEFTNMLEHIVLDFERLITSNIELNPSDTCYAIYKLVYKMFRKITDVNQTQGKIGKIDNLKDYVVGTSKEVFKTKQTFRSQVKIWLEERSNLSKSQESVEKTIYKWLNRMTTFESLEKYFHKSVATKSSFLRHGITWKECHVEEMLRTQNKNDGILSYLIYYRIFFINLTKVLMPLVKLCLHLNNKYSLTMKRHQASDILMSEFVERNSDDQDLENLYKTVQEEVFAVEGPLELLHKIYVEDLKFELGCEHLQGLIEYYQQGNSTLSSFLINTDRPENNEGNMTAILDALIEKQNTALGKFEDLLDQSQGGAGNSEIIKKTNIINLQESDIISVNENFNDTVLKLVHSSLEFGQADQIVLDISKIEQLVGRRLFDGKKTIESVINCQSLVAF